MASTVQTRILVLSDTHGAALPSATTGEPVDVVIHCGDLTEESKLDEYRNTVRMLQGIKADLKLVIAGNHDWTLDDSMFSKKVAEMNPTDEDLQLVEKEYGRHGDARRILESAGMVYLDEGTHSFGLANGALLTVYASPYTPSLNEWAFNYDPREEHRWKISPDVDIAITHCPPRGVLDYTSCRERAGSPGLFAAIARARPLMHCFGHIHEAWGAKMVSWIEEPNEKPSHFTDIDNDESHLLESLSSLRAQKFDDSDRVAEKLARRRAYDGRGHCTASAPIERGQQTLFVNAAIEGEADEKQQWPSLVTLQLPVAGSDG